jgi:excinuclease ABC subunit C
MAVMGPDIRRMVGLLPQQPGVYRFRDARGGALYIGRATQLRGRVGSYWSDLRDRPHLARMVPRVARIEAAVCASVHEAAWLERNLLETSKPRWNRTPGGQETPVFITLDAGPAAPCLCVAYSPAPGGATFGPYLGGTRTRRAIAALHRVHPLAYTGKRLTGSERDLAAKRGVCPADRDRLVDALVATLCRDPDAVARAGEELRRLRDHAAAATRFELAGQLQEELAALDWITGTQRATVPDAGDLTIHGWSAGVLVRFDIRAGRLRVWSQRRCTASRAAPLLSATPASWSAFTQPNAELAAALAQS